MIYWDTSCAVKLYASEPDSSHWSRFIADSDDDHVSSALLDLELTCAFRQKESRGHLKSGGAGKLLLDFRNDVRLGHFQLFPVGADVLARATQIVENCGRQRPSVVLRTLDGIHLATAKLLNCSAIATTDERMKQAAKIAGIQVQEYRP